MINNKRIGILTFQRAHNYGAILQVYSLQELLRKYYKNVSVIDYYPETQHYYHYSKCYKLSLLHPFSSFKNLLYLRRRKKRYIVFSSFIEKKLNLSPNNLDAICDDYDVVVIGSDQVWNLKNSGGKYDIYYWGQFRKGTKPRLISYAASMGNIINVNWEIVSELLKQFNAISVREDYLRDCLIRECNVKSEWTLDPTLLQNRDFFEKIAKEPNIDKPYLFYYQARANNQAYQYAKNWARKLNLKFVCLSAHIMLQNSEEAIGTGPFEFLGFIKKASYVITSSFHGTVFCYHFKKSFSTLRLSDGDNGRSESLLSMLGMERKMVSLDSELNMDDVDWTCADERLEKYREFSKKWLLNNLEK